MKANFSFCLRIVRRWEGGYSDHPSDRGGLTKWGISLRFLRSIGFDLNGDGVVDGVDVRGLTEEHVAQLYRGHFWQACSCGQLPAGLDLAVFDCAVNQGPGRAARILQKTLGVKVDGKIGPKTLKAANSVLETQNLRDFMARRAVHYSGLSNVVVFGLGWFRRLFDVHRESLYLIVRCSGRVASVDQRGSRP